jgi:hypothetical protein
MVSGCLIVEFSPTVASIAAVDFVVPVDFMAKEPEDSRHMARLACIPEPSVDLIVEEWLETSPLAGDRVSVEVFMGAEVSTEAEAVAGDSARLPLR